MLHADLIQLPTANEVPSYSGSDAEVAAYRDLYATSLRVIDHLKASGPGAVARPMGIGHDLFLTSRHGQLALGTYNGRVTDGAIEPDEVVLVNDFEGMDEEDLLTFRLSMQRWLEHPVIQHCPSSHLPSAL